MHKIAHVLTEQVYNTATRLTLFAISLVFLLFPVHSRKTAETRWQTGHSHTEGPSGDHAACYSACPAMDYSSETSTLSQFTCQILDITVTILFQ